MVLLRSGLAVAEQGAQRAQEAAARGKLGGALIAALLALRLGAEEPEAPLLARAVDAAPLLSGEGAAAEAAACGGGGSRCSGTL